MKNAKLIFVLVILVAAVIVFWRNRAEVTTDLIFTTVTMPRAMLLTITLVIGFILGALTAFRTKRK